MSTRPAVPLEDAILVDRLQHGDLEAFGELIERHQDRLFNTLLRIVGDREDARDLAQETFLKALGAIGSFRRDSRFYTWLYRIAVNLALTHRRAGQRRAEARIRLAAGGGGDGQAVAFSANAAGGRGLIDGDPVMRAEQDEQQQQVVAALEALEADQRAIIVLRDIEGFDYQQIAEILKVAPGTVKSRLHRARCALRERLRPLIVGNERV